MKNYFSIMFPIYYILDCLIYNNQSKNFLLVNESSITNSKECEEGCKSRGVKWQWSSYTNMSDPAECLCFENVNEGIFDHIQNYRYYIRFKKRQIAYIIHTYLYYRIFVFGRVYQIRSNNPKYYAFVECTV